MADTNLAEVAYVKETTEGETPSNPTLIKVRPESESLTSNIETNTSSEFRSDRQVAQRSRVQISAGGSVAGELSYDTWDDFLLAGMGADAFSNALDESGTDIEFDQASSTISANTTDLSVFSEGAWIRVEGSNDNDGVYKVDGNPTTTDLVVKNGTLTDEAAGASVRIQEEFATIGTDLVTFTLEKRLTDIGQFFQYRGQGVDGWELSGSLGDNLKVGFDFLGKNETLTQATVADTVTEANSNPIFNVVEHWQALVEGGAENSTLKISDLTLSLAANLRQKFAFGDAGSFGLGLGEVEVSGNLTAYFADETEYDKVLAFDDSNLAFYLADSDGNGYLFDVPNLNYLDGQVVAGSKNEDFMAELEFGAKLDALGESLVFNRFAS